MLLLLVALSALGAVYAAASPRTAAAQGANPNDVAQGRALYQQGCITCHGRNAQGVQDRGPSLIGVGSAAVEFQVGTGRMPAKLQTVQEPRKPPQFSEKEASLMGAYIDSLGGGPQIPSGNLRDGALAEGGRLFRLNCASCHNFAGKGGALSSGALAPPLADSTDRDIYAAMLTGPQNMPVFGDNHITPQQKRSIINYIQTIKAEKDPGGFALGRLGPVPETLVLFLGGMVALLFVTLWIGVKS
jgi:ubiquinol-cytochrome c reductase cytochrome c subunit